MVKSIKADELKQVLKSKTPVAILYYADWCGHCKVMHTPWDELEKETSNVQFYKIESDDFPPGLELGFPHFEVVRSGTKKVADGEMSKEDLKKKLFGKLGGSLLRRTRRKSRRLRTRRNIRRGL